MRKSYFGNKLFSVDPDDLENKQLLRSPRRLELDSGDSDKLVKDAGNEAKAGGGHLKIRSSRQAVLTMLPVGGPVERWNRSIIR